MASSAPAPAPAPAQPAPTQAAAPAPAPAPATVINTAKVFVGNLSFKTREPDLAHEFEAVGKVLSANIITRGPRSLGYGFVEFETVELAKKAVDMMNHKEVDGRPINVEVAQRRDPAAQPAQQRPNPRANRQFRGPPVFRGYPPMAGFLPPMQPMPRGRRGQDFVGVPPQMMGFVQPMMNYPRPQQRKPRAFRQQAPGSPKNPSKTTLFVANLPFIVEDENLKEIFAEFHVKEAHVVRRRNGRSKGYGFVELTNEEDQRRALQTLDKIEIEGREVIIKAAMSEPTPAEKTEATADAKTAVPTTAPKAEEKPAPKP